MCVFALVFVALVLVCAHLSAHDPGSLFFNTASGHTLRYSATRKEQAITVIEEAEVRQQVKAQPDKTPKLCLGVATVARKTAALGTAEYFPAAIGSLLHNLDATERQQIHLILFFAHSTPSKHSDFARSWPENVADEILLYNGSATEREEIEAMEREGGLFRAKGIVDYTLLLSACHATNAQFSAIIEDDVIALDGWFHRTIRGLEQAEIATRRLVGDTPFFYLRLFYTETFLGWNKEDWPTYLFWSIEAAALAVTGITGLHFATFQRAPAAHSQITTARITLLICVGTPLLVALFFSAGKATMLPLSPAKGIARMDRYGCCSQGLVFPRAVIPGVVSWLKDRRVGFVDELLEQLADSTGGIRWALVPSVLQHVGSTSTKIDDGTGGPGTVTKWIWNFGFEGHDASALAKEHTRVMLG